ncbi:hypothetical protein AVEN_249008-1, partial [Araneus ventricosus]
STNVAVDGPGVVSAGFASPSTNVAVDGRGVVNAGSAVSGSADSFLNYMSRIDYLCRSNRIEGKGSE